MGLVYLAEDDAGQGWWVKTIRADLAADAAYRARFRSEAQAALRFREQPGGPGSGTATPMSILPRYPGKD